MLKKTSKMQGLKRTPIQRPCSNSRRLHLLLHLSLRLESSPLLVYHFLYAGMSFLIGFRDLHGLTFNFLFTLIFGGLGGGLCGGLGGPVLTALTLILFTLTFLTIENGPFLDKLLGLLVLGPLGILRFLFQFLVILILVILVPGRLVGEPFLPKLVGSLLDYAVLDISLHPGLDLVPALVLPLLDRLSLAYCIHKGLPLARG